MKNAAIACVQFAPVTNQKQANLSHMSRWICRIMKEHPETDLIVFPELSITGYDATRQEFLEMAETPKEGEGIAALKELARRYNVYITYGYAEKEKDVMYNSMILLGRNGETVQNYRKIHPFGDEKKWCMPGARFCIAETDFGKLGMMICYDTSFPEMAGSLCRMGADMLVICSNWEKPYSYDWDLVTSCRAYDNTLYVAAANRTGDDRVTKFFGHSRILDPIGHPLVKLDGEQEGYIWASIDLEETDRLREGYYTCLKDRRPDIYLL